MIPIFGSAAQSPARCGDRIVQVLPQILFGNRQGGEVRKLTGEWNHLAAKPRCELFHGQFGTLGV